MAGRAVAIRNWPGQAAAFCVAVLILGTLLVVALRAEATAGFTRADWAVIRFTLIQAFLSASISVVLAIPVARALARRSFPGRQALIVLLGAPFILPVIVAVLGLLAVFGRAGLVNQVGGYFGLPSLSIYGLHGVVLAHVFFNLPLATRLILQGWQDIPAERFRLAAQLGFGPGDYWRVLEWPMLGRVAPQAMAVIFAICLSSFAVALTLGGGPKATTVELAIYQAFSFDFDLGRAALLACVQIALTALAAVLAMRLSSDTGFGAGHGRVVRRWDGNSVWPRMQDGLVLILSSLFLLLPLAMLVLDGIFNLFNLDKVVFQAALVSLAVSLASALLTLALALPMAVAIGRGVRWVEVSGLLGIAASPLVIGTGLFVLVFPFANPADLALPVTALVNAVMALPFALRILVPGARDVVKDFDRLSQSLRMSGLTWVRLVLLPRLRPQIGFAAGLAAALSMGDLGVIILFADPERATLPLQMYRLMGSYQMGAAAGAGLLLLMLSLLLFWLFDRGGRAGVET